MTRENNRTVGSEDGMWPGVISHVLGLLLAFCTFRRYRNSSVSIVTANGLNDRGSIANRNKDFTLSYSPSTDDLWTPTAFGPNSTG
jgi:hypothetical protein